jgi:hypothetical protein
MKLTSNGSISWQKSYGGSSNDDAFYDVEQTSDGGYIAVGETASYGKGGSDIWVMKLSSLGNPQWQKTYGGTSNESGRDIILTEDGGYLIAGSANSFGANNDTWILKLDSEGNPVSSTATLNLGADTTPGYGTIVLSKTDWNFTGTTNLSSFGTENLANNTASTSWLSTPELTCRNSPKLFCRFSA